MNPASDKQVAFALKLAKQVAPEEVDGAFAQAGVTPDQPEASVKEAVAALDSGTASEVIDALLKAVKEAEAEAMAFAPPITAGTIKVVGTITSAKWKTGPFGTQPKMVVKDPNGNKYWMTVPKAVVNKVNDDVASLVGAAITVTATVKPSDDDPHFGFGSYPKDATVTFGEQQQAA